MVPCGAETAHVGPRDERGALGARAVAEGEVVGHEGAAAAEEGVSHPRDLRRQKRKNGSNAFSDDGDRNTMAQVAGAEASLSVQ
mgnify:CR=1 FL=1